MNESLVNMRTPETVSVFLGTLGQRIRTRNIAHLPNMRHYVRLTFFGRNFCWLPMELYYYTHENRRLHKSLIRIAFREC